MRIDRAVPNPAASGKQQQSNTHKNKKGEARDTTNKNKTQTKTNTSKQTHRGAQSPQSTRMATAIKKRETNEAKWE